MIARPRPVARAGVALPAAAALAGTIAICAVTAFTTFDVGEATALGQQRQSDAFALAQSGLERVIAERAGLVHPGMPGSAEDLSFDSPVGRADVEIRRIRPALDGQPALFMIRSHGVVSGEHGTAVAEHVITQLATWRSPTFRPEAAWTTAHDRIPATGGSIDGRDGCGKEPGIAATQAAPALAHIDWRGLVEGTALYHGAAVRPDRLAGYSPHGAWPIIRVDGDHELAANGRGALIVTGDLRIVGGHEWRGLVLVGGRVELTRGALVRGALVSGLNHRLGLAPTADDTIDTRARVRFDSCDLAAAADAFGALALVPNTWVDGWPPR